MDEIIKLVQEKVGLSEDQAKMAVSTVLGFVKERLPEPIAAQFETLLSSDTSALMDQAQSVMGMLGGLMGKKD
jgi:uncharacterized protein (DUF2267 family)